MAEIDRAGDVLKALRALRKQVDGPLLERHFAAVPRLLDLLGDGDWVRSIVRTKETLRIYGGDRDIAAARAMLGATSVHTQRGVEDRIRSFAEHEFISYDTARRWGDAGLRKLAVHLTSDLEESWRWPHVQIWVGRIDRRVTMRLTVDYLAQDFLPPSRPRVEVVDDYCPFNFPWDDGRTFVGESEWHQKLCVFQLDQDEPPPSEVHFAFVELDNFRSTIHVQGGFGQEIVSTRRVGETLQVMFTGPDRVTEVFERIGD